MRKIIMLLFIFMFTLATFSNSTDAKIIVEDDFNDSIAFCFWETWRSPAGFGTGVIRGTYVKYIDSNSKEKYWLRLDISRTDKLMQYISIDVDGSIYKLSQIDNIPNMYSRIGVSQRFYTNYANIQAFFDIPSDLVASIAHATKPAYLIVDFQNRKGLRLEISRTYLDEFKTLTTLNRSHYTSYLEPIKK